MRLARGDISAAVCVALFGGSVFVFLACLLWGTVVYLGRGTIRLDLVAALGAAAVVGFAAMYASRPGAKADAFGRSAWRVQTPPARKDDPKA